jgi:hypothetical protein
MIWGVRGMEYVQWGDHRISEMLIVCVTQNISKCRGRGIEVLNLTVLVMSMNGRRSSVVSMGPVVIYVGKYPCWVWESCDTFVHFTLVVRSRGWEGEGG